MRYYGLILGILAVWRIAHLLYAEDGPWDAFVRLRVLAGESAWGGLLDCFYCLSLWVSAPFSLWLGETWSETALMFPALSAGAILLERATAPALTHPPAPYPSPIEETSHVLHRQADPDANEREFPT